MLCDTNLVSFKLLKDRFTKTDFLYKKTGPLSHVFVSQYTIVIQLLQQESGMTPPISQCFQVLGLIIMKSKQL